MPEILAIIPARSGSKGLADKNIRLFNGKPLLAHSINHATQSKTIDRVIVSTDSVQYAEIAVAFGAETPFLRPAELATDDALDIDVFKHALSFLYESEGYRPDVCVHLRPTHPIRNPKMIDEMIQLLSEHPDWDSVRSVCPARITPYKMWRIDADSTLLPVASCEIHEAYNAPRQKLPATYLQNACIDVVRSDVILDKHSMTGHRVGGYVQNVDFDIDSLDDFLNAELFMQINERRRDGGKLTICFDIDGVIAERTECNNYFIAKPIVRNIKLVNDLYNIGHNIILFTARGSVSGLDFKELTETQMTAWGVNYNSLQFGKPAADIYVDDRFWDINRLRNFFLSTKGES
jgi:CMP-N-acetylneuraminic acid synthetase